MITYINNVAQRDLPVTDEHRARRAELVEVLLSGRYEQGQGALRVPLSRYDRDSNPRIGYCCLGVAEQTRADFRGWRELTGLSSQRWCPIGADDPADLPPSEGNYTSLSLDAQRYYGLAVANPFVAVHYRGVWRAMQLAVLNDTAGFTLAEIGRVIRDQPADWIGDASLETQRRNSKNVPAPNYDADEVIGDVTR